MNRGLLRSPSEGFLEALAAEIGIVPIISSIAVLWPMIMRGDMRRRPL
jgi:hypothetical protein